VSADEPERAGAVLLVDDNPANLKLVLALLASEAYEVRTATDAQQALAVLETFAPRVILLDIQLPDMDGLALTRRLKADGRTRGIAIIAVTAYAMSGDEQKAKEAGVDEYVTKPIDKNVLRVLVRRHMGGTLH
jgi:CheY-like chemotaxis protein